jgi:adenylate kinase
MIISLTGTPGTGKTTVSNQFKNKIEIINLNNLIDKYEQLWEYDLYRKTKIINIKKLNKIVYSYIHNNKIDNNIILIEGHLSHLLKDINKVILLRTHPQELKRRLIKRNWNKNKIKENIESEILDIILCECVRNFSKNDIFEIDTTNKKIKDIFYIIDDIIKKNFRFNPKYHIGNIDWSNEILK